MLYYLVTGCAGFIGSHLCEKLLVNGHKVVGLDNFDDFYPRRFKESNIRQLLGNSNFQLIEGSICSTDDLKRLPDNVDCVIHLAAKTGVRPSIEQADDYFHTNILGTKKILDWMVQKGVKKMIFASSSSIYGNNEKVPFSESDIVDYPISPYAFTKKACELMNYNYHHLYGLDIINLRFFTVYGPRQRPDLAIRKFSKMIKENRPVTLYGDGSTSRDYTYIEDIISGIIASCTCLSSNNSIYDIINIGNGSPTKLADLVEYLYRLNDTIPNIQYLPMQKGDVLKTYADITKAKKKLNYFPTYSILQGLSQFTKWHEEQMVST